MGQWLSERLGQSFIIENRPGAGGNIATEAVVRAPADGYVLLLVGPFAAINATLYEKLNFNFLRDIAPVASFSREPQVMVLHPSVPTNTVPEFIGYAKANPGKISMASGGNGSPAHVAGELFKMMTGVNMVHVPYRGGASGLTDLIGDRATRPTASRELPMICGLSRCPLPEIPTREAPGKRRKRRFQARRSRKTRPPVVSRVLREWNSLLPGAPP
jgi:tripartite-type tricarboxylate transporter receptor subunit TctC